MSKATIRSPESFSSLLYKQADVYTPSKKDVVVLACQAWKRRICVRTHPYIVTDNVETGRRVACTITSRSEP